MGTATNPQKKTVSEPTERVVRGIVRGIDRRKTFVLPTPLAWLTVTAAHWLPRTFDGVMSRWVSRAFRTEIDQARSAATPSAL